MVVFFDARFFFLLSEASLFAPNGEAEVDLISVRGKRVLLAASLNAFLGVTGNTFLPSMTSVFQPSTSTLFPVFQQVIAVSGCA